MIAIGGVIGAGLFVGSGVVINETGPAAFLSYAITGVLIILVMRMLGEMATANPSTGSFADYARQGARRLGGLLGRLAVLVLLGDRRRLRGDRRREDHPVLVEGSGALDAGARTHGPDDPDQPDLGEVVRRVRVLVRRHQGRGDHRLPRLGALFVLGLWPTRTWTSAT
jgi:amino acid transporter